MSLGPPFDASGIKLQQAVGAGVVLALGAAVAWVLFLSGRTIGRGVTIHVEMKTPGLLHPGGKVRLAGNEIGEVRGMVTAPNHHIDVETFVLRDWVPNVHENSQFYVATPSVLGEAYLEVGPPANGAAPGPSVTDGDHVRGADPPEIDDLLAHSEKNLRLILALLRDNRPEMEELLHAGDDLLATLSGLPADRGQLRRIRDQFVAALDDGTELLHVSREIGGVERVKKVAHDLGAVADQAGPELHELGEKLDLARTRIDSLATLWAPERRAQISAAMAELRKAVAIGEAITVDVKYLANYIQSGRGTIGAFLADQELFDDLHETHRILKSQPWTLILKPQKR